MFKTRWLFAPLVGCVTFSACLLTPLASTTLGLLQLSFLLAGLGIAAFVARLGPTTSLHTLRWAAVMVVALGSPLLFSGGSTEGMKRWLALGPILLNISALVLPPFCVSLVHLHRTEQEKHIPVYLCVAQAFLVFQPDAGSATLLAAFWIAFGSRAAFKTHVVVALMLCAGAVVAWLHDVPIAPVPHTEGILGLALAVHGAVLGAAVSALVAVVFAPLWWLRTRPLAQRRAGAALALVAGGWCLLPMVGPWPVPWLGFGGSPILGMSVALGLLARRDLG